MEIRELDGALRGAGHRVTNPRRAVWDVIQSADAHLTAEEIAELVKDDHPGVNVSSVYRTLSLLHELGLVRESSLGPSAAHWEVAHPDQQFHLRCNSCGRVEHHGGDIVEQVRDHLRVEHGFEPTGIDLVVSGTCSRCS